MKEPWRDRHTVYVIVGRVRPRSAQHEVGRRFGAERQAPPCDETMQAAFLPYKWYLRFRNPSRINRELTLAATSCTAPKGGQTEGMEGLVTSYSIRGHKTGVSYSRAPSRASLTLSAGPCSYSTDYVNNHKHDAYIP